MTTDLLPSRSRSGTGEKNGIVPVSTTHPSTNNNNGNNSNYNNGTGTSSGMEEMASQHYIIGDNLRAKAFYQDAIDEFQKAMSIQEPLLQEHSPIVVAKTHYALGLSYRAIKEFKPALYHLTKATTMYDEQQQQQHSKDGEKNKNSNSNSNSWFHHPYKQEILDCKLNIARTHHSNGVLYQRMGEYDKSIVEHRKSLAIREQLLGKSHLETARSYYVIGCALSDRGNFDEALAELRRSLRIRLLIFGRDHKDTKEVVSNLGTVLMAKGGMTNDHIHQYMISVLQALDLENDGDRLCRLKDDPANGMVCYRRALSLEEQALGDLHPTTCDLYLKTAEALAELGDLEASLVEYKSAIQIYERLLGRFHVKVAQVYSKLAGILMEKGEYETALCFYCKSYGIYDAVSGTLDDTKQALMNVRLAAAKERSAKQSMDLIKKAEDDFKAQQELHRQQEQEVLKQEEELILTAAKEKSKKGKKGKKKPKAPPVESAPAPPPEDII